jgi:hypothetical protein
MKTKARLTCMRGYPVQVRFCLGGDFCCADENPHPSQKRARTGHPAKRIADVFAEHMTDG